MCSAVFFILPPFLHRSKNVTCSVKIRRFEDGAAVAVCSGGVGGRRQRGDHHGRHASPRAQDVIRWRICLFPPDTALGENILWLHPASLACTRLHMHTFEHRARITAWPVLIILTAASPLTTHHTPLISRHLPPNLLLSSARHSPLTTCCSSLTHWCCTSSHAHTSQNAPLTTHHH